MAFTIRELSPQAEKNLTKLIKSNLSYFKTKTKAIDFVLRVYYNEVKEKEKLTKKIEKLEEKLYKSETNVKSIKEALKFVKDFI